MMGSKSVRIYHVVFHDASQQQQQTNMVGWLLCSDLRTRSQLSNDPYENV
jgi:hypothetical protein